jgi:hypothetical protein
MKTIYYTTTDSRVNIGFDDVLTFDSIANAHSFHQFGDYDVHAIKPLDRYEFGSEFTLSIYDHNGELVRSFDCKLDKRDGGWFCADPESNDTGLVYYEIFEMAQWMFNEESKQVGVYEYIDFECDCDDVGSQYAWIVSAK